MAVNLIKVNTSTIFQQEQRLERKEERLHHRAINAALHGDIGKAVRLEHKSNQMHNRLVAENSRKII